MDTKPMTLQGQAGKNIPQEPLQGHFQQGMLLLALAGAWESQHKGMAQAPQSVLGWCEGLGKGAGAGRGPGWSE